MHCPFPEMDPGWSSQEYGADFTLFTPEHDRGARWFPFHPQIG